MTILTACDCMALAFLLTWASNICETRFILFFTNVLFHPVKQLWNKIFHKYFTRWNKGETQIRTHPHHWFSTNKFSNHPDNIMIQNRHRSKELTETFRLVPVLPLNSSDRTSYEGVEFDHEKGNLWNTTWNCISPKIRWKTFWIRVSQIPQILVFVKHVWKCFSPEFILKLYFTNKLASHVSKNAIWHCMRLKLYPPNV